MSFDKWMREPLPELTLRLVSVWNAAGYRDLTLNLSDDVGKQYTLRLAPADVQRVINGCADAAKQIGTEPPIDWDQHPETIYWPKISEWRRP